MTSEGKVKKAIKDYLTSLGPDCRFFMTQNMGMGESGVADFIGTWKGRAFAIEAKSDIGKCTPWQTRFLNEWETAGGVSLVVCGEAIAKRLGEMFPRFFA